MAAVRTTVEELPESKVRLEVQVPEQDVRHAIEHAAADLAGTLRIPGFRKGKVPLPVVTARIGRQALWEEALRSHVEGWFWTAAFHSGVRAVGQPELDVGQLPPVDGEAFTFTATVSVIPEPELADWRALEVPSADVEIPHELVEAELERLRATVAELVPVEGRTIAPGDVVVLDLEGDEMAPQHDYALEVGSGRLVEEVEQALVGMRPGESREVEFELADERKGSVRIAVKSVKERLLPPLDDELARSASEFDTLAELQADIEERLCEQVKAELEARFREESVDALAAASRIAGAEPLVERRTAELASGLVATLERRGIKLESYLAMSGQTQDELVERLRLQADRAVRRELVLGAVAQRLGLEVVDGEVEALVRGETDDEADAQAALERLRHHGGFEKLREDLRLRKAVDEVAGGVKRIPVELAKAREKLWTPEKEKGGPGMNIWTPGREEAR